MIIPGIYKYGAIAAVWLATVVYAAAVGHHSAATECKADELQKTVDAQAIRISELEVTAAMSKDAAQSAADRAVKLEKEISDAAEKSAAVVAGLRNGGIRVRERFTCPKQVVSPDAAPGDAAEARTGFGAEDAVSAFAIAREGDDAIRSLNSCIDGQIADRALLGQLPKDPQ